MAKLSDAEDIRRMTVVAQKRNDLDLRNLILDNSRLCPGCGKPKSEQPGKPRKYFGEEWCSPCIDGFVEVAKQRSSTPSPF